MIDTTRSLTFKDELAALINRHSVENASSTPDFLLAQYLQGCLDNFTNTVRARDKWYGHGSLMPEEMKP